MHVASGVSALTHSRNHAWWDPSLGSDGAARAMHFDSPEGTTCREFMDAVEAAHSTVMFFDRFDEYAFLEWFMLTRPSMGRMTAGMEPDFKFVAADLNLMPGRTNARAPDLPWPGEFPTSWKVMF